jgi:hypothetical protein
MEAEVRAILTESVRAETGQPFDPAALQDFIGELFKGKPPRLTDELIRERRREQRNEGRIRPRNAVRGKRAGARDS